MLYCPNATSVCYSIRKLSDRSARSRKAKRKCDSHFLSAYSCHNFHAKIIFKRLNPKRGAIFQHCK